MCDCKQMNPKEEVSVLIYTLSPQIENQNFQILINRNDRFISDDHHYILFAQCLFYYYKYMSFVSFVICHYPLSFLFGLSLGRVEHGKSNHLEIFFSLVYEFTGFVINLILKSQCNTVLYLLGRRVNSEVSMEHRNHVKEHLNHHSTVCF